MKDVITKEHVFPHAIDKVWKAITVAEEISTWFIKADFKATKGYRYTFTASEESGCTQITGEIKEADPYRLTYTWMVANTEVETTVTWVLSETAEGTHLHLEHSGISKYAGETAIQMFHSFNGGWDNCVSELDQYLKQAIHAG
ncbi:MAG: SRPBCC domain-containing protein [Bacteroidota bacterium]